MLLTRQQVGSHVTEGCLTRSGNYKGYLITSINQKFQLTEPVLIIFHYDNVVEKKKKEEGREGGGRRI